MEVLTKKKSILYIMKPYHQQSNDFGFKKGMILQSYPDIKYEIKSVIRNSVRVECQRLNKYGRKISFTENISILSKAIINETFKIIPNA